MKDRFDPEQWLKLEPAARARFCRLFAIRARELALKAIWPDNKKRYVEMAATWEHLAVLIDGEEAP